MLKTVLFLLTLVFTVQTLASGDNTGLCPSEIALNGRDAVETLSILESRNKIHHRVFTKAKKRQSMPQIARAFAAAITETRSILDNISDERLDGLLEIWAEKIFEERGRLPGFTNDPSHPGNWLELEEVFAQDPTHLHNVYSNYTTNIFQTLSHITGGKGFTLPWGGLTEMFFPTLPHQLLIHKYVTRWLEKHPDAKQIVPKLTIYHEQMENRFADILRF
jgi:hypothetical protein